MRLTFALALLTGLALGAPAWSSPPQGKPPTAGPKTPKVHGTPAASHKPTTTPPPKSHGPTTTPGSTHAMHAPTSNVPANPKLTARLQGMLPAGMSMEQAAAGFKNQGQFIAAVNVAKAHDISFSDLKGNMVDGGLSLGQSIHKLKPSLDGDKEAAHAMAEAEQQLEPR